MNTNTTLTERDKKLLNVLVYIVIIFVFVWCLIRPLCNKITKTYEEIQTASALRSENEAKIMGLASARTTTDKFSEDLASSTAHYYDYMDSSDIDKLMTSFILDKGLTARDLTIIMPEGYVEEKPYTHSQTAERLAKMETLAIEQSELAAQAEAEDSSKQNDEPVKEAVKTSHLKDAVLAFITGYDNNRLVSVPNATEEYVNASTNANSTESSGLLCVKLSVTMEGDPELAQKVIDELSKNPSMRITSFRWGHMDPVTYLMDDGSILIVENEDLQLTIGINLYMKDRTEVK